MLSFCRSHCTDLQSLSMIDKKTCGVGGFNCFQLLTVAVPEKVWKSSAPDYRDFYRWGTKMTCTPTRPGVKGPSVSGSLRNSLSTLWFLVSFGHSSLHPPPVHSKGTRLCVYIYLCVRASICCQVKEMNVSPGKILGSSVYSLEAFAAITSPGQVRTILFSPPSLLDTCPSISFFLFFSFTGIPDLVMDPNVNYYQPRHTDTAGFSVSIYIKKKQKKNCFLQWGFSFSLSHPLSIFFIIFSSSTWVMTHLLGL